MLPVLRWRAHRAVARRLLTLLSVLALAAPAYVVTTAPVAHALNAPICGIASTPSRGGYWLAARDGGVFAFGDATYHGNAVGLSNSVVGITPTPSGLGYWLVASDGGVFALGDARFFGSAVGRTNAPIVGMARTPTGLGYWLAASDGGVFAFGDAVFAGNALGNNIVGIAAHPTNGGYWLNAANGAAFAFPSSTGYYGGMNGTPLNRPMTGIASSRTGNGYWMVAGDGGVFAFGDAPFRGSMGATGVNGTSVGIAQGPAGDGYWIAASDGGVFAFGSAPFLGNMTGTPPATGNPPPSNSDKRTAIVNKAKSYKGYNTPTENKHKFSQANDEDGVDEESDYVTRAWCADFMSYVWIRSGVQGWQWTASVSLFRQRAQEQDRFRDRNYVPAPGDVAIWQSNSISHVNLIVEVRSDGWVRTVGGNEGDDTVVEVTSFYNPKTAHGGALVGYAVPDVNSPPPSQEDNRPDVPEQNQGFLPEASISDISVVEGQVANFVVTLSYGVSYTSSVAYSTVDGTATSAASLDYTSRTGTLSFPAGGTSLTVSVPTTNDTLFEQTEQFNVVLSSPQLIEVLDGIGSGTIFDNDHL